MRCAHRQTEIQSIIYGKMSRRKYISKYLEYRDISPHQNKSNRNYSASVPGFLPNRTSTMNFYKPTYSENLFYNIHQRALFAQAGPCSPLTPANEYNPYPPRLAGGTIV